jgi:hypothetical protein
MIFVGIDDTDNAESGGTGRVARGIAACLREQFPVLGVSRHQFLVDPRVPYTSNNSGNVIHLLTDTADLDELASWVSELLLERCLPGSDPGLCVARDGCAGHPWGAAVQTELVSQPQAFAVAVELGVILRPLGGTGDGVIGALAGAILAAGGNDGRFVEVGRTREMTADVTVAELLQAGVKEIRTREGQRVDGGLVNTREGRIRPLLKDHAPVLLVEPAGDDQWRVVELGKGGARRKEKRDANRDAAPP